ncbi:hypothetical protein C7C46_17860 [Streptomyces tateyamensis]|uniref:SIS domain-containing protein n=1 Tax=Streptomyces tateyamensis TaxID=565073 RepID=A0A2V4N215_9ACTN|nr:hypothetical protein [Streptomyces tateyamensis]PYC77855.1 hypothetical protein C7C46_17860 [Streptomyces tateyamensis]
MDAKSVGALRQTLAGSPLLDATRGFAAALRAAVTRRTARGLLLVGSTGYEPWHLAAHLDEEAAWSGVPQLAPRLVRHQPTALGTPAHLRLGLDDLAAARRGQTVLVVTPQAAGTPLLERMADARRGGATVLALAGADPQLTGLAHQQLTVDQVPDEGFDLVQHLVSAAAGEPARTLPGRLARLARQLGGEPAQRW